MNWHEQQKREVIQHELGHWITARHHETYTDHIEISRDEHGYGHCNLFIFPKLHKIEDARKLIESRIRTLMAGAAAQLIDRKEIEWSCVMKVFESNGADDYAKINEYLSFTSGFDPNTFMNRDNMNDIFQKLFEKYWSETVEITKNNEETIRALRDYILSKLDHNEASTNFSTTELVTHMEKNHQPNQQTV